jgi:hypothetical protein
VSRFNLALCCEQLAIHEIREAGATRKYTSSSLESSLQCLELSQEYIISSIFFRSKLLLDCFLN